MFYPAEFKKKVKEAFPNDTNLHSMLEAGSTLVGRVLDDSSYGTIPVSTILNATSLEELQIMARTEQNKVELYREWCSLYSEQNA